MLQNIPEIKNSLEAYIKANEIGKYPLSYSQMSMFWNCPFSWQLAYINKIKSTSQSIHLIFGTAIHKTLQDYLDIRYNKSELDARHINLSESLFINLAQCYKEALKTSTEKFTTNEELALFHTQGVEILNEITNNINLYFPTNTHKLIACELPLFVPSDCNENVLIVGFIDIVLYDTVNDVYVLIDLKTSGKGWNDYKKKDFKTNAQLLTYKQYFSKQYNIDIDKIDVKFIILKRELYEDSQYAQKRIQLHIPAHGKIKLTELNNYISSMISSAFIETGQLNLDYKYPKIANDNNCRFCDYKGSKHCNKFPIDPNNIFNK